MDSGPILWNRQLILAKKSVALPSKNGVVAKTAENGVAVWEKENLQQTHRNEGLMQSVYYNMMLKRMIHPKMKTLSLNYALT